MKKIVMLLLFILSVLFMGYLIVMLISVPEKLYLGAWWFLIVATFMIMLCSCSYFINCFPIILSLAIIAFIVCSLFPPWYRIKIERHSAGNGNIGTMKIIYPVGYGYIAEPPTDANGIDFGRLGLQYVAIIVPSAGLLYLFRKRNGSQKNTV